MELYIYIPKKGNSTSTNTLYTVQTNFVLRLVHTKRLLNQVHKIQVSASKTIQDLVYM